MARGEKKTPRADASAATSTACRTCPSPIDLASRAILMRGRTQRAGDPLLGMSSPWSSRGRRRSGQMGMGMRETGTYTASAMMSGGDGKDGLERKL